MVVVAVALAFGLIPVVAPAFYSDFPSWLETIFDSGISAASIMAVVLNLFFNVFRPLGLPEDPLMLRPPHRSSSARVSPAPNTDGGRQIGQACDRRPTGILGYAPLVAERPEPVPLSRRSPMPAEATLSYTAGETDVPLLEQTIGDNLDATVARFPDREALVDVRAGPPVDLRRAGRDGRPARPRPASPPASARATGSASGRRTAPSGPSSSTPRPRSGAILVNINPAYRTHELKYVLGQAGIRMIVAAPSFKTATTPR